jgi:cytochrome d ubiquinol oxidase subunit I
VKFAALELVPKTSSDVPETILGHLNSQGQVVGGFRIPGLASILSDPSTGTSTVVQGLNTVPASSRPTDAEVNIVHLAWDVMVGMATLLFLLSAWYALCWLFKRDNPKAKVFWWLAASAGVASILALEAGWVVTEVGRQPWVVFNYFKVTQAATSNHGVWFTFLVIFVLYLAVATLLILVLRSMSRRWRAQRDLAETEVPYGPAEPVRTTEAASEPEPVG